MRYSLIAVVLLGACSTAAPQASPESCNAGAYAGLIGQDAAASLALPEPKRVYVVGEPITQDFIPERINVQLDETDTIIAVTCG